MLVKGHRNPTEAKREIELKKFDESVPNRLLSTLSTLQAADTLRSKVNLVPVGEDLKTNVEQRKRSSSKPNTYGEVLVELKGVFPP